MRYLHTMIRVSDLEASLDFFCNKLGLVEHRRSENEKGRYTLVFLTSPEDLEAVAPAGVAIFFSSARPVQQTFPSLFFAIFTSFITPYRPGPKNLRMNPPVASVY